MFYPNLSDIQDIWITQYPQFNFGLNAVTSFSFSQSTPKRELNVLGKATNNLITDGAFTYNINVSKNLINQDTIWSECTGKRIGIIIGYEAERHTTITGYIEAHSGFLESYSVDASVGSVPQSSASFIFENRTGFYNSSTGVYTPPNTSNDYAVAYIPQTGIVLNLGGYEGNNIIQSASFSAQFTIEKNPIIIKDLNDSSNRGNYFISSVVRPILYTASVTMLKKDYAVNEFLFRNPQTWELKIYKEGASPLLNTYTIPNAELVGESVNITAEGVPTINLEYKGVG